MKASNFGCCSIICCDGQKKKSLSFSGLLSCRETLSERKQKLFEKLNLVKDRCASCFHWWISAETFSKILTSLFEVCEILEEVDTKIMKFDPKLCISNCILLGWKSHLNFKKHLDSWVFHDSKCNHRQYKKQFKLGTWNATCILLGDVKVVKEGDDPRADVRAKTQMFWIEFDYIDR